LWGGEQKNNLLGKGGVNKIFKIEIKINLRKKKLRLRKKKKRKVF